MYAVIETGGKQYKVQEGDVIQVERLIGETGSTSTFDKVLAVGGDDPKFGTPFIDGANVAYELVGESKAKKIIVFKMKRRKSYRRKQGHRQIYSTVKITGIKA
ncbi:MAG: 50S ribosomal protein L21 [Lentisphaeraceae bacterium]|nr:50S ribosomal protein L21 [Lentisphaeraceae bacterium]